MFIIIFVLILLLLVITHEFGHFLAAKRFGIKVLEFGFGIPPKVWSKKIGETTFSINALPLGGFVRLLGEDEVNQKILKDPRSFAHQEPWKRMVVVAAGVGFNLVLSWILFYTILLAQDFRIIYPTVDPVVVIAEVQDSFPAKEAGVQVGERLIDINGVEVKSISQAVSLIKNKPDQSLQLTLADINGDSKHQVTLSPKLTESGEGLIGVAFSPIPFKQYQGFTNKLFSGITYSADVTKLTLIGLKELVLDVFKGDLKKASQSVAGPVGLVSISYNISQLGVEAVIPYLWYIAMISIALTIFNSLPFPALDGGRFLFIAIEAITKKRVNPELERTIHNIGMAVLLALIVLITISDIRKLF